MPKWNLPSVKFPYISQQQFLFQNPDPIEADNPNHAPIIDNVNFQLL